MNVGEIVSLVISAGLKVAFAVFALFFAFRFINLIMKKLEERLYRRRDLDKTVFSAIFYGSRFLLKALVILSIVAYLGVDISGITALIASLGVGVGLAVNGALSNLAGGVLLLITRPFKIDDFIETEGFSGTVEDIRVTFTRLRTPDNKVVLYVVQGIAPMTSSDYDIWFGSANVKATICNTASSDVKIAYRANGGEWTSVTAKYTSANLYTATFAIGVESTYEYKLVVDGVDFGSTYSISTPAGVQLPNSDFERWHTSSDIVYPYASGDSPFWLTGNEGSNMAGATLTQASKDVRPGSTGTYSAYLESQFASVFGIGKFAAGNLFTGTFSLSGTNGTVGFGRDFAFTAKPKSITFWMKYNEGTIDQGSQASGADLCSVMVMITDWATPYAVNTADSSTFFTVDDLPTMKGVIGYAAYQSKVSNTEWTEYTLDITYREDMANVRPKKIVVSFTPSGYGDYFCGSTNSWMYVDDIKLNY